MATRGYIEIKENSESHIMYNHWDSYLEGLGEDTVQTIKHLLELNNLNFSNLLKKLKSTEITGYYPNDGEFGYLVNMDDDLFEININTSNGWTKIKSFTLSDIPNDWLAITEKCIV